MFELCKTENYDEEIELGSDSWVYNFREENECNREVKKMLKR